MKQRQHFIIKCCSVTRYLTYYDQRKGQPLHIKLTTPKPVETPKPEESEETSKESTAEAETILTSEVEQEVMKSVSTQALQGGGKVTVG